MRILREPSQVGAAIDHSGVDFPDEWRRILVWPQALTVPLSLFPFRGARHEAKLDATAGVGFGIFLSEFLGKRFACNAAVDPVCAVQLAQFDHARVDDM